MNDPFPLNPADRPSRLPSYIHATNVVLVALGFLTGAVLLYFDIVVEEPVAKPEWLQRILIVHGCLVPFQTALFGYLCAQHIRYGWQLKANQVSGFAMESCFVGLILTGVGLYYLGSEPLRELCQQIHSVFGVALPITLGVHWFQATRWVKSVETSAAAPRFNN